MPLSSSKEMCDAQDPVFFNMKFPMVENCSMQDIVVNINIERRKKLDEGTLTERQKKKWIYRQNLQH